MASFGGSVLADLGLKGALIPVVLRGLLPSGKGWGSPIREFPQEYACNQLLEV